MSSVFNKPPGNVYILPDGALDKANSKLIQFLTKDDQGNMPMNSVMQSALMGERSAIQDIRELGINKVMFGYTFALCSRVRHLMYFKAYTDTVITFYLEENRVRRTIDRRP